MSEEPLDFFEPGQDVQPPWAEHDMPEEIVEPAMEPVPVEPEAPVEVEPAEEAVADPAPVEESPPVEEGGVRLLCPRCNRALPMQEFVPDKPRTTRLGRAGWCRDCGKGVARASHMTSQLGSLHSIGRKNARWHPQEDEILLTMCARLAAAQLNRTYWACQKRKSDLRRWAAEGKPRGVLAEKGADELMAQENAELAAAAAEAQEEQPPEEGGSDETGLA